MIDIQVGDTSGYAMVPGWVIAAGTSGQAVKLYAYLASLRDAGDGVWPKQHEIASVMGVTSTRRVAVWVKELEAIGALSSFTITYDGGMRRRLAYRVHRAPLSAADGTGDVPGAGVAEVPEERQR